MSCCGTGGRPKPYVMSDKEVYVRWESCKNCPFFQQAKCEKMTEVELSDYVRDYRAHCPIQRW